MELWLIRHGETEWSRSGQHTGRTDLELTQTGKDRAAMLGRSMAGRRFELVLSSPLLRARETCRLVGYGDQAKLTDDLLEWDYGDYEGITTADIRKTRPSWYLWRDGVPRGETAEQVGARVQRVIDQASQVEGRVAVFAHGHVLRVLTACWLGLEPRAGRLFALETGTVSVLAYEHETRVIRKWNVELEAGEGHAKPSQKAASR